MNTKGILIFTDWYAPAFKAGGPVTSLVNLVRLLQDNGYRCFIVTGDRDLGDTSPFDNVKSDEWIEGFSGEKVIYLKPGSRNKKQLNKILEDTSPNYIYYNSLFSVDFFLKPLFGLKKSKAKLFLSPRGMLHPGALQQKKWKKRIFLLFSRFSSRFKGLTFLATDQVEAGHIKRAGYQNPVKQVPNVPDTSLFELNKEANPEKILIVSRVAPEKNSISALNTLSLLNQTVTCVWVGDAKDQTYFDAFINASKKLPDNITFDYNGALPKEEVKGLLKTARCFFLPTLGENFGHAIFEALASGTPSVIGENTPFKNIEKHGAGYAHEATDLNAFSQSIQKILEAKPADYTGYRENARSFARFILNEKEPMQAYREVWP